MAALAEYSVSWVYDETRLPKVIKSKIGGYYFPSCRNDVMSLGNKKYYLAKDSSV